MQTNVAELNPLLARRRSPRAFDPTPVPTWQVRALLEAARWAPSAFNRQPWAFIVTQRGTAPYARLLALLSEGNRVWTANAPLLILTVAETHNERGENRYAFYDLASAVAQLTFQALDFDLYVHQMAGFDKQAAREAFRVPEHWQPATVLAVGRLGDPATLPDALRERETAPRQRKPLTEIAFGDHWGRPLDGLS